MNRQPEYFLTVDLLVSHTDTARVLLIQRRKPPFEGSCALPGGHIEVNESPEQAARRELQEETGLQWQGDWTLTQLGVFGEPGRDPCGPSVSILYLVSINTPDLPDICAGDDAGEASWFSVE